MTKVFSSIHFDPSGTMEGVESCIRDAMSNEAEALFLLIGSNCKLDRDKLPALFNTFSVAAMAAVFPGVIYAKKMYPDAVVVCGLVSSGTIHLITHIDKPEELLRDELTASLPQAKTPGSAFLVLDGLSQGVDNFISCLFDCLGPDVDIIGGGCGFLDGSYQPGIITADGLLPNAAILIFQSASLASSYQHGWKAVAGPFLVSQSEKNLIHQLNFQPALPFYRAILEQQTESTADPAVSIKHANRYPFGLEQQDSEYLVRDPIAFRGDSIECAGSVPTNAMVDILHVDNEGMIAAAGQAAANLCEQLSPAYETEEGLYVFVIDCVSRQLVLTDSYHLELEAIGKNLPTKAGLVGVLAIGEVANSAQGNIQFLNKTTVLGGLGK